MTFKNLFYAAALTLPLSALYSCGSASAIDRQALVERNNPHITAIDTLASLSVGNGEFAVTVDVTGLQTFPVPKKPLRTMTSDAAAKNPTQCSSRKPDAPTMPQTGIASTPTASTSEQ